MKVRRALLTELSDAAYDTVQSFHSDSAVCFSIFLHHLPDLTSQHPPNVLLHAMEVPHQYPCMPSEALARPIPLLLHAVEGCRNCCAAHDGSTHSLTSLGQCSENIRFLKQSCTGMAKPVYHSPLTGLSGHACHCRQPWQASGRHRRELRSQRFLC